MNKTYKVDYTSKDFQSIKNSLMNYAKRYYPNNFSDLSEASINSFMIDAAAYVGDILSYYTDFQANESFLATAVDSDNILKLAKSLGYKRSQSFTTAGKIEMYMLLPSKSDNTPDYSKAPIIKKGTVLATLDGSKKYLTNEDVVIDENFIGANYVVARTNIAGNPTYYAIKFSIPIISGEIKTQNIGINSFIKFNKVFISDSFVEEIISVVDSEGNEYYEVPNLSQNIVYKSVLNTDSANSQAKYTLKPISAQRRFVLENDGASTYLMFGARQYKPDEDLSINPIAEPSKFILSKYNNDYLSSAYFEPNKLINGDNFGIGPENTTLTVRYRKNSTNNNTANTAEIVSIKELLYQFNTSLDQDTITTVIQSIQVINEEAVTGVGEQLTNDEIKDLAGMIFQTQNRAVTAKDYETLAYMMPSKYGSIKRVKAERDPRSLKNNINLYVVCVDSSGFLASANTTVKQNLKQWLADYKMITDTVDIIDAKIVNLGIDYTIRADPNYDKLKVNQDVLDMLREYFNFKPQIGEAFSILDVYREIQKVDGVLDIKDGGIKIKNITDVGYSQVPFNVEQNITDDGNLVLMPRNAIFEIKDVNKDITGKVL